MSDTAAHDFPLPPPTFEFFVLSLKMQTEVHLGLFHFGEEKDRPEPDLRLARHSIDLLAMVQEKTKGNLSLDEQRLLENTLTELRFRYVQKMEEKGKAQAPGAGETAEKTDNTTTETTAE
jgi:hypothetical protein